MKSLQGSQRLLLVEALEPERDHADGVLCSANVPRPSASSFISLRRAHHRRDRSAQRLNLRHNGSAHVRMASGAPRSEIKEEPKAGDIRGGEHPVSFAPTPNEHRSN